MHALKAHVLNGRLVLDEPTDLPEGTEVPLRIDDDDDMAESERARLHAALRRSIAQAKDGQLIDGDDVIGRLGAGMKLAFTPEADEQADEADLWWRSNRSKAPKRAPTGEELNWLQQLLGGG